VRLLKMTRNKARFQFNFFVIFKERTANAKIVFMMACVLAHIAEGALFLLLFLDEQKK